MKKRQFLISAMLVLIGTGVANAKKAPSQGSGKAYTYVQQDGVKIDKLGTATFEISAGSYPTLEIDASGKAVMKIGDNTVAKLPISDNGQLVVEFETTVAEANLNKVTKTYTNDYATLYSPFQLTVPEGGSVEVYAPTYDEATHVVNCNSTTQISASAVIPVETALLLKNAGTIDFAISALAATDTHTSALSGSSLQIDVPSVGAGNTLYTLGQESTDASKYGFFRYTGSKLNPGLAWLTAASLPPQAKCYTIVIDNDEATGISLTPNLSSRNGDGKFLENGRVVIVKNGKKFNLNGQAIQ